MVKTITNTLKLFVVAAFVSALALGGTQLAGAQEELLCDTPGGTCLGPWFDCGCDVYCKEELDHPFGGTCDAAFGCCVCFD